MARFHATPQGRIPFTPAEEAAADAKAAVKAPIWARRLKLKELRREMERRMGLFVPAFADEVMFDAVSELWKSIAAAAKNPTQDFQDVSAVRTAGRDAKAVIEGMTDPVAIEAYDVMNTPSWP